ncbi:MAG: hypothetical protein ACI86X_000547 [Moritella sp.]|jgi:hypothetical protein
MNAACPTCLHSKVATSWRVAGFSDRVSREYASANTPMKYVLVASNATTPEEYAQQGYEGGGVTHFMSNIQTLTSVHSGVY